MAFHTNTSGWAGAGTPPAKTGGSACGCDTRGPDPEKGGDLVQVARALAVASRVDAALERHAPMATNAKGDKPLTPRGVLTGKPHSAPERATQRQHRTRWGEVAEAQRARSKPSTNDDPLRPRGILSKEG